MSERSFTVSGIHCGGCTGNIESGLQRLDADAVATRLGFPVAESATDA